jgi:hypothetical protein
MEPAMIAWCADNIAKLEIERCGIAAHVAPEDQPEAIAAAIAGWGGPPPAPVGRCVGDIACR